MPTSCCVIGCKSRGTAPPGVLFFQLPLNKPGVLTQWLIVLDRRDWIPKPSSRICSLHFAPDDYIARPNQASPRLKPDAIPSVFPDLGDDDEDQESISISPQKENDISSENAEEPIIKPPVKSKPPAPPTNIFTPPVGVSPLQRPRRVSKVSSKMKDYILLDDIKKHRQNFSPVSKVNKPAPEGDRAAQELLSILEDSNSLSGDESKFSTPRPRQPTNVSSSETKKAASDKKEITSQATPATKIDSVKTTLNNVKTKPAPASVKRAKELALQRKNETKLKGLTENKLPQKKQSQVKQKARPVPESLRKKYFQVKDGDKIIYLSYADLNPVADMTKDNVLYKVTSDSIPQNSLNSLLDTEIKEERIDMDSDDALLPEAEATPSSSLIESRLVTDDIIKNFQKITKKKAVRRNEKKTEKIVDSAETAAFEDAEMIDSDSSLKLLSDKGIGSPAIKKNGKNFKVTSPVKRKKRFKTVAEIVVRTDNSGQVPSVSIEKMTNLENNETPRKKPKVTIKPAATPSVQSNCVTPTTEEDDLTNLSERITETIKKMKLLEKVKGNAAKLTVLITTLPPVQENELLIIKKKNTETNFEQSRELRVAISSYKPPSEGSVAGEILLGNNNEQGDPQFVPILGACESGEFAGKESTGTESFEQMVTQGNKDASENPDNLNPTVNTEIQSIENAVTCEKPADDCTNGKAISAGVKEKEGGPEGTEMTTSAPLQHDHTYISPSLKVANEPEAVGDDHSREIFSKLKLSEEEISYRSKVHKKLRFLKETVKRKTETINKLKQKVTFLEKSLRDERKHKRRYSTAGNKRKPGFENNSYYEDLLEGNKTIAIDFQGDVPADFEENLEESDEDGRGSHSPITYICEPAIDVCEKADTEE